MSTRYVSLRVGIRYILMAVASLAKALKFVGDMTLQDACERQLLDFAAALDFF